MGCPGFATKMFGIINKDIKAMLPNLGKANKLENARVCMQLFDTLFNLIGGLMCYTLSVRTGPKIRLEKKHH